MFAEGGVGEASGGRRREPRRGCAGCGSELVERLRMSTAVDSVSTPLFSESGVCGRGGLGHQPNRRNARSGDPRNPGRDRHVVPESARDEMRVPGRGSAQAPRRSERTDGPAPGRERVA